MQLRYHLDFSVAETEVEVDQSVTVVGSTLATTSLSPSPLSSSLPSSVHIDQAETEEVMEPDQAFTQTQSSISLTTEAAIISPSALPTHSTVTMTGARQVHLFQRRVLVKKWNPVTGRELSASVGEKERPSYLSQTNHNQSVRVTCISCCCFK